MQYPPFEQAPLNIPTLPPLYSVNLPGGNQENAFVSSQPTFINPNVNFNVLQQPLQTDNSFVNSSFTAPLMQQPPNINPYIQNNMNIYPQNIYIAQNNNNPNPNTQIQNLPQPANNISGGYALGTTVNVIDALIPKTGYEKLMVPGIFVKQKMEWMEIFTGCETENSYKIYACDVAGNKEGHPLFKCREKSSCAQRQCLPGDCRKFNMDVTHDSEGKFTMDGEGFLELVRPFKFTCLWFQRPFFEVNYCEDGKSEFIGRIVHNFDICNMSMSLLDKTNVERYTIKGSVFQVGLMNQRGCFCKSCQQAFCFIHDITGEIVGIIEKRGKGFRGMISDADNFSVLFPIKSTLEERACILAATLFLDFRYFEDSENNRGNTYY